jgi:hypothetical protein
MEYVRGCARLPDELEDLSEEPGHLGKHLDYSAARYQHHSLLVPAQKISHYFFIEVIYFKSKKESVKIREDSREKSANPHSVK